MKKYYWLVYWLERWPDGIVKGFKTAVHCESLSKAVATIENELQIRTKANGTEIMIWDAGITDEGAADLVGKAETDSIAIEWPE